MICRIKCLRKLFNQSQESFAKQFHVSQNAVSNWEQGKNKIDIETATKIAEHYRVPVDFIYGNHFDIARPVSIWNHDEIEDMKNANADCKDYFLYKYGRGVFNADVGNTSNINPLDHQNVYMIPVYENAAAGFGAYASDQIVDYMPLFIKSSSEASETICIRVSGDSMYPTIENGDIIQVHKQTSVDSGSVAVILLDGESGLVKRVCYGPTWIELQSINPMYAPMIFEGPEVERIQVVGLVKKVIKEI